MRWTNEVGVPGRCGDGWLWILGAALLVCVGGATSAAELELFTGGRVTGKLLNPNQNPRREYTIEADSGIILRLAAEQVKEIRLPTEREQQYADLLARMPNTLDGHWAMSKWCQQNFMKDERQRHLEACIELEPDHEGARRALGYTEHDGKWMLVDVLNRQQGMLRHGMRWQLPAEIALERSAEQHEVAEKQLASQLRLWRTWYLKGKNLAEARGNFLALRDPLAVPALGNMLEEEDSQDFKRLMIRAIRNIGAESGSLPLIEEAMRTGDDVILSDCFDALKELGPERATAAFTANLKAKTPREINRAAAGLAAMEAVEAVPQLIDALVTTHKIRVGSGSRGSISPAFTNNGGGGLSMGGGPKEINKPFNNQTVLDALATMTGNNFGFNEQAWKNWLIQQRRPVSNQLRRGP